MKKVFVCLLCLMFSLQGAILPEIEWDRPPKWQVINLESQEAPYAILTEDKAKIVVFRYRWQENLIWSITKSWRSSLNLPILTSQEVKSQLSKLKNGSFLCSFQQKEKVISGAFFRHLGNLWVFKFSHENTTGIDVFKDFVESVKAGEGLSRFVDDLSSRASSGSRDAQIQLADYMLKGKGVNYDEKKAFEYLNKARAEGLASASYRLALLAQEQGEINSCLILLEEGANKKHLPSLKKLSGLLLELKKDYKSAVKFLTAAAELGDSEAMHYLGEIYSKNNELKDPQKAFSWVQMAAQKSYSPSLVSLAQFYRTGVGTEINFAKALSLLYEAIQKNNSDAFEVLGDMTLWGQGIEKDSQKALAYYVKATTGGSSSSLVKIAEMYIHGNGVDKNMAQALKLLSEAARRGEATAMNILGDLYTKGIEVSQDFKVAYNWYLKSAEKGNADGMFALSLALFVGKGVTKDKFEAVKWMKLAASEGHEAALKMLKDTGFIQQ